MSLKNKSIRLLILIIIWYSYIWLKDLVIARISYTYTFGWWAVFFYSTTYLIKFIFVYASCFLLIGNQVDFKKLKFYDYILLSAIVFYTIFGFVSFYNIPILYRSLVTNTFITLSNYNTLFNGLTIILGIYIYSVSTTKKSG